LKRSSLQSEGLSRGTTTVEEAAGRISTTLKLSEALDGAFYAQESTCETVEFKKKVFTEMDKYASSDVILASSTSTIPASKFTQDLKSQCIVAHPVNPPLYLTLVEMVPAPWTHNRVVQKACEIMKSIGQEPVHLHHEVLGFAVNRLQYALLAEAWRLVADDVLSPEDVDKVMSAGLGPRYAIHGPLQTVHLNANGVRDYFTRYGDGIRRVLADQGPMPTFEEAPVLEKLEKFLNGSMPLDQLAEMKAERERNLARLASLKKKID
uniref:Lambda-crystallin n=1 Tax=Haemonchus placei TaxID=6290 RepID=A0A0N4VUN7_HAEPC